jgi:hypothetical protein
MGLSSRPFPSSDGRLGDEPVNEAASDARSISISPFVSGSGDFRGGIIIPRRGGPLVAGMQMIKAAALANGHALSFTDQPALQGLFSTVKAKRERLTLVVGAGVSMNAGLPSWQYLVSQMANSVRDDLLQKMLRSQSIESLERKAEMTIQIARANKNIGTAEIIRDALYSGNVVPKPGLLALSIARLNNLAFSKRQRTNNKFRPLARNSS